MASGRVVTLSLPIFPVQVCIENLSQAPLQVDWTTYLRSFDSTRNLVEFLIYARRGFEPAKRKERKIISDVYESGSKVVREEERDEEEEEEERNGEGG